MTGHDHHWTFRVANHMLGHASEEHAIESGTTMYRDHHEINIGLARLPADFVHCVAGPNFRCAFHFAQEIELRERFHVQAGIFQINRIIFLQCFAGLGSPRGHHPGEHV